MTTLVFRFPMPPNLTNPSKHSHWRAVAAQKKKFYAQCDDLQRFGMLPSPPKQPFAKATISAVLRLGHAMDDDNAMARTKWCGDWLKTRGYIADDRRTVLKWAGLPEQIVGRKQEYTVELTLTQSEAA